MSAAYTRESWKDAYSELLRVSQAMGLPEEIGKVIAGELRTERCIRRMTAYLLQARPRSMEEIADEMMAIIDQRNTWAAKKEAQEANARYNEWLNSPMRFEEEE
ncbi:MAG: hypothetical protein Q4C54_05525 [Clostridia bacterium]|nr:hypothetical protein [Clostridia bacterium]